MRISRLGNSQYIPAIKYKGSVTANYNDFADWTVATAPDVRSIANDGDLVFIALASNNSDGGRSRLFSGMPFTEIYAQAGGTDYAIQGYRFVQSTDTKPVPIGDIGENICVVLSVFEDVTAFALNDGSTPGDLWIYASTTARQNAPTTTAPAGFTVAADVVDSYSAAGTKYNTALVAYRRKTFASETILNAIGVGQD